MTVEELFSCYDKKFKDYDKIWVSEIDEDLTISEAVEKYGYLEIREWNESVDKKILLDVYLKKNQSIKPKEKELKLKIGSKVKILDGSGVFDYCGMWIEPMNECVGKIYTVSLISGLELEVVEEAWMFDSRYVEVVE